MEKQFITYEQSLALKELGFDEPCFGQFYKHSSQEKEELRLFQDCDWNDRTTSYWVTNISSHFISAPTFSQAFEFFREKYGYDVTIKKITKDKYQFIIELICVEDTSYHFVDYYFDSYNEAESACIDKLIKIVKNK